MNEKSYKEKLLDPRWQRKRIEILNRDNFSCCLCKDTTQTLHIHHKKYTSHNPWEAESSDLITVCKYCHEIIESLIRKDKSVVILTIKKRGYTSGFVQYLVSTKTNGEYFLVIYEIDNNVLSFKTAFFDYDVDELNDFFKESKKITDFSIN